MSAAMHANRPYVERILVVDDNENMRRTTTAILKAHHYDVFTAKDGVEGLTAIRHLKPHLVLLDLQMPNLDGMQVIKRLKQDKIKVPVVLMTAHGSEQIVVEVFRQGVKDYLMKPYQEHELLESVERGLVESRLRRKAQRMAERVKRRSTEVNMLSSIGRSITELTDMSALILRVVGAASILTQSEESRLYLADNGGLQCRVIKYPGVDRPTLVQEPVTEPLVIEAFNRCQTMVLTPEDIRRQKRDAELSGALVTPLVFGDRCMGMLMVKNYEAAAPDFNRHDATVLDALADYAAIAIHNAHHYTTDHRVEVETIEQAAIEDTVFVSYSRRDWDAYALPMVERLREAEFNVWVDQHLLQAGNWLDEINHALRDCPYMVLCVTPDAMESDYVKIEYRYFIHKRKPIIPVICEPAVLPAELLSYQRLKYDQSDTLIDWLKVMIQKRRGQSVSH